MEKTEKVERTISVVKSALQNPAGHELMKYLEQICHARGTTELSPFEQGKRSVYWKLKNLLDVEAK